MLPAIAIPLPAVRICRIVPNAEASVGIVGSDIHPAMLPPPILGEVVEPPMRLPILNIARTATRYGGLSRRDVPPVWMID